MLCFTNFLSLCVVFDRECTEAAHAWVSLWLLVKYVSQYSIFLCISKIFTSRNSDLFIICNILKWLCFILISCYVWVTFFTWYLIEDQLYWIRKVLSLIENALMQGIHCYHFHCQWKMSCNSLLSCAALSTISWIDFAYLY